MHILVPLPVVAPLALAALLAAIGARLPRRLIDLACCLTAGAATAVCAWLTFASAREPLVYWFGGWRPVGHVPIGISFVVDPIGAGLATLAALLVCAAFVFSWRYFESIKSYYHCVMLIFLAAMCGLCLTGDLFNLFVWFELMTAAGVMLCGYKSEETGPLEGALNFAIMNTLGAYLTLSGIAIVYGQTGALNFAQVAASLRQHDPGGSFIPIAFLFVSAGFLVKAAVAPFHFWLADAHAVAPTPVCVLFSGVMVELGLYAVARLYWSVFAVAMHDFAAGVQDLFLAVGTATALIGGVGCFGQRHLKRLLAFSTISHMGLMFIGFALLDADALAGTALYVVGHGLVKSALFICMGIMLHRFGSVDEFALRGTGHCIPWIGVIIAAGALGLAGLPCFATYFGAELINAAAERGGFGWIGLVFDVSAALTAAAVLRITARIFLGWGERQERQNREQTPGTLDRETQGQHRRTPFTMWLPALAVLVLAVVVGAVPDLRAAVRQHARQFQDTTGYGEYVRGAGPWPDANVTLAWEQFSLGRPIVCGAAALALALAALFPHSLGQHTGEALTRTLKVLMHPFHAIHSGRVGDYVAWFMLGMALWGGILLMR